MPILGKPCCLVFGSRDQDGQPSQPFRTLLMQEILQRGVLATSLVVNYSHTEADIDQTIAAFASLQRLRSSIARSIAFAVLPAGAPSLRPLPPWKAFASAESIVGFYHSHPTTSAEPSSRDLELAVPGYMYVIIDVPRGRILGGSSAINGMVYIRGHALDYDRWAKSEGATGWSYFEVLPYFKRAEHNDDV